MGLDWLLLSTLLVSSGLQKTDPKNTRSREKSTGATLSTRSETCASTSINSANNLAIRFLIRYLAPRRINPINPIRPCGQASLPLLGPKSPRLML